MQIQVIPIRRLPFNIPHLDYLVDDGIAGQIRPGQLVSIPFRGKDEFGLIISAGKTEKFEAGKLKPINGLVFAEPLLAPEMVSFFEELSAFYRAPIGFILKTALLPMKKSKLPKIDGFITLLPQKKLALPSKPVSHIFNSAVRRDEIVNDIAGKSGQRLILCPETGQIDEILSALPGDVSKKAIVVSGELGAREYFDVWTAVRSRPEALVIGTRKALFLPWINLNEIALYDEGNPDYKSWDMAPRYHARDAALMLAKHTGARLHLISPAPSVETYFFVKNKIYDSEGQLEKISRPAPIFANPKSERRAGNYGLLSLDVLEKIDDCEGDVFVNVSRRMTAGGIVCHNCGLIFRCESCKRPMSYYQKDGQLHCRFCKKSRPLPETCPDCRGPNYRMFGLGADGAAEEIKNSLKTDKNIIVIDKDAKPSPDDLSADEGKIIVGTDFAWPHLDWKRIKLFIMADPDIALSLPEYKSAEELWQKIRRVQTALSAEAEFYIQTNRPEHPVYRGLYDPPSYYEAELNERKTFGYPPYNYIVRLYYGELSQALAEREASRLYADLSALTNHVSDVKISRPIPANPPFWRARYWQVIIVKFNYKNYKKRAREIFTAVPEEWKIDPNPNSILSIS